MSELHQQLKDKILEQETIRKICEHTIQLQARLHEEEKDLAIMDKTLTKEQRDVSTLEQEGLSSMFYKFLGDREERIEKEREEYLKASLRFNELFRSVELIRFELEVLSKKEQNLEVVQEQIDRLIKEREEELMKNDPIIALELKAIHNQTDKQNKFSIEIDEALKAGHQAHECVSRAEHYLLEAQRLGQRDMWGGGYHSTGHMKHQVVDYAREMVSQTRHYLIGFANELRDVFTNAPVHFDIEIEEFGRFADVFFDNLISDWMVQKKINKSLTNISATRGHVEHIIHQLNEERGVVAKNLDLLEEQRKKTIVNSGE